MNATNFKLTKIHAGRYNVSIAGQIWIANYNELSASWNLLQEDADANGGYQWCQSYTTLRAIRKDLEKLAQTPTYNRIIHND